MQTEANIYNATNVKGNPPLLDTLAQPRKVLEKPLLPEGCTPNKIFLQRRARRKAITDAIVFKLIDLKSPMHKSYWQTYRCTRTIIQEGNKLSSRYCNQRFCLVCNSIRTAKLIRGYESEIKALTNPYFVTLTVKNVKGYTLRKTIDTMQKDFVSIKDKLRKRGIALKGIRKIEVTFNETTQEYHPHFHCIIESCKSSFALWMEWKRTHPAASIKGQDIRHADTNSPAELFKYFTKMLTKDGQFLAEPMDIVFRCMKGKRVFQPFGGIKKQSEDIETDNATEIDWKPPVETAIYSYQNAQQFSDWYNSDGEALSDSELNEETMHLLSKINT